jgi:hypothetical protein
MGRWHERKTNPYLPERAVMTFAAYSHLKEGTHQFQRSYNLHLLLAKTQ